MKYSVWLRWLVELKLIQLEEKNATPFYYFSNEIKTKTLPGRKKYMKFIQLEINNLRIQL